MKNLIFLGLLISSMLVCSAETAYGQKKVVVVHKNGYHHPNNRVVVVKRSRFRPAKAVVFHPVWGPRHAFHRRWVFFPKYNIYWDNWRNVYYYKGPKGWIYSSNKPTVVINVNLDNEKHYELPDTDDDNDEIYDANPSHVSAYPE
jgi:hypothetical protein